jgi:hypothetical protein
MEWTLSETIALASESCVHCQGFGMYRTPRGDEHPCECVLRAIFRACYSRFRVCVASQYRIRSVPLEWINPAIGKRPSHGKNEEYIADFCLVSNRALEPNEHLVFRYHYLLGADGKLCCRYMRIDRPVFFRYIYEIEQKLGRVFRELKPYSLYPLDEYFCGAVRKSRRSDARVESILRRWNLTGGSHSVLQKIA